MTKNLVKPKSSSTTGKEGGKTIVPRVLQCAASLGQQDRENPTNRRKSTRYNAFTFLPITLFLQFTRVVNIFYVSNAILQSIPSVSTHNPLATILPLTFIILFGITKEAIMELKKWYDDNHINATLVTKMTASGTTIQEEFQSIKVGDILEIRDGQALPADCVLLKSTSATGQVYVETAALDGERNLKPLLAPIEIQSRFESLFLEDESTSTAKTAMGEMVEPKIKFRVIKPIKDLYTFQGKAIINSDQEGVQSEVVQIDIMQFLHRGAVLRNSDRVLAIVVNTGVETKLAMNLTKYRLKQSTLEYEVNMTLLMNFILMIGMSGILALANLNFNEKNREHHFYIYDNGPSNIEIAIQSFASFYLILNSFIPMEIPVVMEVCKFIGTYFMENDATMSQVNLQFKEVDKLRVNNMNLHEDLANISYIFCDKTGTLTQNELVFQSLSLALQEKNESKQLTQVFNVPSGESVSQLTSQFPRDPNGQVDEHVEQFFKCVGLCHDCIVVTFIHQDKATQQTNDKLVYQGPSLDEYCLLEMAQDAAGDEFPFFSERDSTNITLKRRRHIDDKETFKVLKVFKFTSERKCSSVVVRAPDGKVYAYIKGSELAVKAMLSATQEAYLGAVELDEEDFARRGLRTLYFGFKEMQTPIDGKDWDNLTHEEVESDITLLGATGIEDLLQEDVKMCIQDFRDAGIKVWMLTGDKGLTAKQIGMSCGIFSQIPEEQRKSDRDTAYVDGETTAEKQREKCPAAEVIVRQLANSKNKTLVKTLMMEVEDTVDFQELNISLNLVQNSLTSEDAISLQLMISGRSMAVALEHSETRPVVTNLVLKADSVILYRSSPAQKAEMVELIKTHARGKKTLAIGDGANDVNMIIRAHIGVGILSKEGNQASSFADYSIPQYKHLRRLLFWHGRPFGERLMNAVVWLIYRCMTFSICIFYLNLQNGFSGMQPIESLVFAVIYVNMTPFVLYLYIILEVEVSRKKYGENEALLSYTMSELYGHTRSLVRKLYRTYFCFILMSFYTGAVIFGVYFLGIDEGGILSSNGHTQDLFSFGVITIMVFALQHHLHIAFMMRNWTVHAALLWLFSLIQVFLTYLVAETLMSSELTYSVSRILWMSPHFWLQILLATFTVTVPFYLWKVYKIMIRDAKFLATD